MDFRRKIVNDIRQAGRSCISVLPDADSTDPTNDSFVYTIGNTTKGFPELLVVGIYHDQGLLNKLSQMMIERGRSFDDGETFPLYDGGAPISVITADDAVKDRFTIQATEYLGRNDYRVMQVVLSDKQSRLPWDDGCATPYGDVKVWRRLHA